MNVSSDHSKGIAKAKVRAPQPQTVPRSDIAPPVPRRFPLRRSPSDPCHSHSSKDSNVTEVFNENTTQPSIPSKKEEKYFSVKPPSHNSKRVGFVSKSHDQLQVSGLKKNMDCAVICNTNSDFIKSEQKMYVANNLEVNSETKVVPNKIEKTPPTISVVKTKQKLEQEKPKLDESILNELNSNSDSCYEKNKEKEHERTTTSLKQDNTKQCKSTTVDAKLTSIKNLSVSHTSKENNNVTFRSENVLKRNVAISHKSDENMDQKHAAIKFISINQNNSQINDKSNSTANTFNKNQIECIQEKYQSSPVMKCLTISGKTPCLVAYNDHDPIEITTAKNQQTQNTSSATNIQISNQITPAKTDNDDAIICQNEKPDKAILPLITQTIHSEQKVEINTKNKPLVDLAASTSERNTCSENNMTTEKLETSSLPYYFSLSSLNNTSFTEVPQYSPVYSGPSVKQSLFNRNTNNSNQIISKSSELKVNPLLSPVLSRKPVISASVENVSLPSSKPSREVLVLKDWPLGTESLV